MAKSHPASAQSDDQDAPRLAQWARSSSASFALLACIASLSTIFYNQHGVRIASALVQGFRTLELNPLAMHRPTSQRPSRSTPTSPSTVPSASTWRAVTACHRR